MLPRVRDKKAVRMLCHYTTPCCLFARLAASVGCRHRDAHIFDPDMLGWRAPRQNAMLKGQNWTEGKQVESVKEKSRPEERYGGEP